MEIDSLHIAEDDKLRSACIRKLVQKHVSFRKGHNNVPIPKIIIQYWHDLNNIPDDVMECLNSWDLFSSKGFQRVVYDDKTARIFIENRFGVKYLTAFNLCHHPAMRCDYFRLCYILDNGGFYVDADEFYLGNDCQYLFNDDRLKIQPLCYDNYSGSMIPTNVFLKEGAHSPDWIYYVNNNPLIAPPGHPVIKIALERATELLLIRDKKRPDIQSTTGPGNLSASLVRHWIRLKHERKDQDFEFLSDWESYSISKWPLSYRSDERNWRIWNNLCHNDVDEI